MIIDQDEIEALLSQADELKEDAEQTADTSAAAAEQVTQAAAQIAQQQGPSELYKHASPEVRRILRVRVPVLVQLATKPMPVSTIRRLSAGAIIEFEKSVEEDLELYVRNRKIGDGNAVKVGEHFGLRITEIDSRAERIKSLGGQ